MIIGISGKMATGKTTLADILAKTLKGHRISFADALRTEVADTFCIPPGWLTNRHYKDTQQLKLGLRVMTIREILQWWGQIRREGDPNYWVRVALGSVIKNGPDTVIFDDVRYQNEAAAIRERGGMLVRLEPYPGWLHSATGASHSSETDLDGYQHFDFVFTPRYGGLEDVAQEITIRH